MEKMIEPITPLRQDCDSYLSPGSHRMFEPIQLLTVVPISAVSEGATPDGVDSQDAGSNRVRDRSMFATGRYLQLTVQKDDEGDRPVLPVLCALTGPAHHSSDRPGTHVLVWQWEGEMRSVPRRPTNCPRQPQAIRYRHGDRAESRHRHRVVLPAWVTPSQRRSDPEPRASFWLRENRGRHRHPGASGIGRRCALLPRCTQALEETAELLSDSEALTAIEEGRQEVERGETGTLDELRRELDQRHR